MQNKLWTKGLVIGIILLFFGASVVPIIRAPGITWDVTLSFTNGGQNDNVVFGEAPDAHDGPPADTYDVVKPPAPPTPYIRVWLNDSLPSPYDSLSGDYRQYPGVSKVWNLTVQWMPSSGSSPTTITISWDLTEFIGCEYTSVNLSTEAGTPLQNMLVNNNYVISNCPAYTPKNYKIICSAPPNQPPMFVTPSPVSGSTGIALSPKTNITVSDADGDPLMITWFSNETGSWVNYGHNNTVGNGTYRQTANWATTGLTKYWWRVTAFDGHVNSSVIYDFTTKAAAWVDRAPTFSSESPVNGSTGVSRYHATNVTVSDLDGNASLVCTWYSTTAISGPWTKVNQTNSLPANATYRDLNSSFASGWNMKYWWRVTAFDGHVNSSVIYDFTTKAAAWVDRAPTFSSESPVNGSTGVSRYHATNVTVSDLDGNASLVCTWYSTTAISGPWTKVNQTNSLPANATYRDLNSSFASGWNMKYWWRVTAYDGHVNVSAIYNFTTTTQFWVNRDPVITSPSPSNGSVGVPRYWFTNITVSDADANQTLTVCFWNNSTAAPLLWKKAQQNNSESPSSHIVRDMNASYASAYSTKYWWKVTVYDGIVNVSAVYHFITNSAPMFGSPSPVNGSTGRALSFSWSIPINDPDGDSFNWAIQCSNGQTNSGTSASNGTKSLYLSSLVYSKTYKVWVNATDPAPAGSGLSTRRWYTFTTTGSGGGGGGGGGLPPTENQKPVADLSVGEPYQGFVKTEITFNGSKSHDPDGTITNWFWAFGDNLYGTGKTVQHTYSKAGTYTVTLTVTDNEGATNTDATTCVIKQQNRPPTTPIITGPTNGTKNTMYTYTAVSTDADNDTIQYTFDWGDSVSQFSGFLPNRTIFTVNHSWAAAGRYNITVTVTDNQTESFSKIIVYIDAVQTGEIGYLLDNNGDGTYDAFYSEGLKQTMTIQKKNGNYNIDSDGDGDFDYMYNETNGLTVYQTPLKTPGFKPNFLIYIIIIIVAVICSIIVLVWLRKNLYI